METQEINRSRCELYSGQGIRFMLMEIAARITSDDVGDTVATMRAAHPMFPWARETHS